MLRCRTCRLGFLATFPQDPWALYDTLEYYQSWNDPGSRGLEMSRRVKEKTADWVLGQIERLVGPRRRLLEVGCAFGHFLERARARGYDVHGVEVSPAVEQAARSGLTVFRMPLEQIPVADGSYDAIVLLDVIEHLPDPVAVVKQCRRLLNTAGGILLLITPDLESLACKVFKSRWVHFKSEHLYYYSKVSLTKLLRMNGFEVMRIRRASKGMSLRYLVSHSVRFGNVPPILYRLTRYLPGSSTPFRVPSELCCLARVSHG